MATTIKIGPTVLIDGKSAAQISIIIEGDS